jgi:hypothetical protein
MDSANIIKRTFFASLLLLLGLLPFSCTLTGGSGDGLVIDALKSGANGVQGVTVTLYDSYGEAAFEGESEIDGAWIDSSIPSGKYTISASKSGWFFPDITAHIDDNPTIPGIYLDDLNTNDLVFLLMWNEEVDDLDLYLTCPDGDQSSGIATFDNPYSTEADINNDNFAWSNGFGTGSTTNRLECSYANTSVASGSILFLREDSTGKGPETIRVIDFPTTNGNGYGSINGTSYNGLPSGTYEWQGVAEIYIDAAYKIAEQDSGFSAEATVYALQKSSSTDMSVLGKYTIPSYTDIQTAAVVRINIFDSLLQLVPDIRVLPGGTTQIKSPLAGAATGEEEPEAVLAERKSSEVPQ